MKITHRKNLLAVALLGALAFIATLARAADPLPSWNDGPAKQSIIDFVDQGHHARLAGLCAGAGTHRHVRQRRHALVREAVAGADFTLRSTA